MTNVCTHSAEGGIKIRWKENNSIKRETALYGSTWVWILSIISSIIRRLVKQPVENVSVCEANYKICKPEVL